MPRPILLFPLMLLAACGTPQEQCIATATRDLRTVEALIKTTEGNLARGFAYQEKTVFVPRIYPCALTPLPPQKPGEPPRPRGHFCHEVQPQIAREPVAIDTEAEKRKLRQLQDRRKTLLKHADAATAACRAQFPE
jgi:hypothetical protein